MSIDETIPTHITAAPAATRDRLPTAAKIAEVVAHLRARRPRVHVLTSPVAQTFTANMLLAIGAEPSMTISPEEIPAFVASADGLLVNLGMLDRIRRDASLTAIEVAKDAGVPWVLDPVKIEVSPPRLDFARRLIELEPALVHTNHAEFLGLAEVEAEEGAVRDYAVRTISTLVVTGEVDIVTDGKRLVRVANGHPLMDRVTAMGCAATAIATAFRAVEPDPILAATAALVAIGVAGEMAAASASGPGSFAVEIVDALYALDAETLTQRARIR
ncbi:MAG: hydroxyethylthiazole kinase [Siculibacillus sp.]|nr:hydroxyethylthiazole kinase [Siculibacillus sp.]